MTAQESSHVDVSAPPFRAGTRLRRTRVTLAFNAGGIGDFINWTTAIQYAIESNPHITGYVLTPPHFLDLARLWFDQYIPRFEVLANEEKDLTDHPLIQETALIAPDARQYANTCGTNLFRLGFIYYTQSEKVPKGWNHLPRIRGDEADLGAFKLPMDYAVITPYATAANKRLTAKAIEEVSEYLISVGLTPVFLGKHDVAPDHKGIASDGLRIRGLDLRERTTLREAACIMARARFVLGLDNGLLHLAACSTVPIVWAFTTVEPAMIVPPRGDSRTLVLTPPESLTCRFCQNRMRYVIGHNFKNCLYGDNLCTETFNGALLIDAVRKVLA